MALKTNTGFRRVTVITFIFLNCILTAVPFTYASSTGKSQPTAADYPSQNHSQPDSEENNHFKNSEHRYEGLYTATKKRANHSLNTTPGFPPRIAIAKRKCAHGFISSSFPSRPGYYRFLFLYQLF
jgi:hypothetical protein